MKRERLMRAGRHAGAVLLIAALGVVGIGCGQSNAEPSGENPRAGQGGPGGGRPGGRGGGPPGGGFPGGIPGFGGAAPASAIPVRVTSVIRRAIADYLETNGSLEAENEVDIVARTDGPIVELNVEEGDFVRAGQVLARIDAAEIEAQLGIARVNLAEAELVWNRAQSSYREEVISQEAYDLAESNFDAAAAQIVGTEILLDYTVIRAPFDGLIIERVIKNAEHVSNNARLFRLSDFDPLLCPIQLPEKDLPRLELGQTAYLTVEAYPGVRFPARVCGSARSSIRRRVRSRSLSKCRPRAACVPACSPACSSRRISTRTRSSCRSRLWSWRARPTPCTWRWTTGRAAPSPGVVHSNSATRRATAWRCSPA